MDSVIFLNFSVNLAKNADSALIIAPFFSKFSRIL